MTYIRYLLSFPIFIIFSSEGKILKILKIIWIWICLVCNLPPWVQLYCVSYVNARHCTRERTSSDSTRLQLSIRLTGTHIKLKRLNWESRICLDRRRKLIPVTSDVHAPNVPKICYTCQDNVIVICLSPRRSMLSVCKKST